jgi:serine/threonine protein phosphatase 1
MTDSLAFIGDVHGNIDALQGIIAALDLRENLHLIFLGDYINKGKDSSKVLDLLLAKKSSGEATLLAGNHEAELIKALETGNLTAFIKMGGATTIRSYLARPVRPDVLEDFREHFPAQHLAGLRTMPQEWESDAVVAQHVPRGETGGRFLVSAHTPVGPIPRISATVAQIDTGCGAIDEDGRLTALLWPSREYLQVDNVGRQLFH